MPVRQIDVVYIDTSVFEAENFFHSHWIKGIYKLAEEGYIMIIMPEITYNEILKRSENHIISALSGLITKSSKILKNIPSLRKEFSEIKSKEIIQEFKKVLEDNFEKSNCQIIEYGKVDIKKVFEKYFNITPPFGKGGKRKEFPDAFALDALEEWCKTQQKKCHVISNDKDLIEYKSQHLIIVNDKRSYLNDLLKKVEKIKHREERLNKAVELFYEKEEKLNEEINRWLYKEIKDATNYDLDEDTIEDICVTSTDISINDYKIYTANESVIILESEVEISYEYEISINSEGEPYYDEVSSEWMNTGPYTLEESDNIVIQVLFKIDIPLIKDISLMDIGIYEINKGSNLTFSVDSD